MAIRRVSFVRCMLVLLFGALLGSGVAVATVNDGREGEADPGDLGVRVHVNSDWIVNSVGEFRDYDHITVLHIQVFNDGADDVFISPRDGLRLLRHMPGDPGDGVIVIGPTSTRVLREPPTGRVVEVSSAESTVFTELGDTPQRQGYLLAQSMISGHNAAPTDEVVVWQLPSGESHHFSIVIAAKAGTMDLFSLDLVVGIKDGQVIVPNGLHAAVIDGIVHAYIAPGTV